MVESISLDEYIRARAYMKSETYTQDEVIRAIENLILVRVVSSLPTENIRDNQLYLIVNDENLPEEEHNKYDLFIHVDGEWEQLDSLEFKISDYPTITEMNYALTFKSNVGHGHEIVDVTNHIDGFMSWEQQEKLNTVEEGANKTLFDNAPVQNSSNAITSGAVYTELGKKAPNNHRSKNTNYGVSNFEYYGHSKAGISVPPMNTANGSVGTDNGLYARADHTHPVDTSRASNSPATSVSAGLMTANDKSKLDNIENEANKTVVDTTVNVNSNNPISNKAMKNYVDGVINGLDFGEDVIIDSEVTSESTNPVSSKAISEYVEGKFEDLDLVSDLNALINEMKAL